MEQPEIRPVGLKLEWTVNNWICDEGCAPPSAHQSSPIAMASGSTFPAERENWTRITPRGQIGSAVASILSDDFGWVNGARIDITGGQGL